MLFGVIGEYGDGKTSMATVIAYAEYLSGRKIYSNYHMEFPHTRITSLKDMDKITEGSFFMDEAWYTFDSRNFGTKTNKAGSMILSKFRKRGVDGYLILQSLDLIDSRFRERLNAILVPELIYDDNNCPLIMELGILFKNKFGGYDYRPNEFILNVSQILDMYDTNEELVPLY